MKALITGANGQVGRALVAASPKDWNVVALGREQCDLADPSSIRAAIAECRPDLLFNAAAYTAVDRAESEESLATAINATAPRVMRDALEEGGGRLVHISTDFVFDGGSAQACRPDAARHPLSCYGRSKALGEDAAGASALIVRTSWVYGAGGSNFVRTMLRLLRERDEVRVVADQIGAPTWAAGLAQTLWALALKGATGIFHHRDAGVASWYDFAVAIQEEALAIGLLDRRIPVLPIATADFPTLARRPAFSLLDDTATRTRLGDISVHWRVRLRQMLIEEKALVHAA